jgi:hypothetical protein
VEAMCQELKMGERSKVKVPPLDVPPRTHFVTLAEREIGGGALRNFSCPECKPNDGNCAMSDFMELEFHYERWHGGIWREGSIRTKEMLSAKKKKEKDWSYHFFCPLPGCKYNVLSHSKHFSDLKQLKQHYTKVHASRDMTCTNEGCDMAFSNGAALARHVQDICGRHFVCPECGAKYGNFENLLTHGRRKNHVVDEKRQAEKAKKEMEKRKFLAVTGRANLLRNHPIATTNGGLVRIAPKSSTLHLRAAIALSELSTARKATSNADAEIQTEPMVRRTSGTTMALSLHTPKSMTTQTSMMSPPAGCRKRCAETQTSARKRRRRKFVAAAMQSVSLSTGDRASSPQFDLAAELKGQETQTRDLDLIEFDMNGLNSLVTRDRPLWTASTQTSPKYSVPEDISPFKANGDFHMEVVDKASTSLGRPPRIGEIEQFSTETQTDAAAAAAAADEDWADMFGLRQIEAETQFDLDDILCSNYTQTGVITHDMLLSPMETTTSIETQTIFADEAFKMTTHMETQTMD